jgi:arginase
MLNKNKTIGIMGVQLDKGAERRGIDMGPSAIRYAGLSNMLLELGYAINDSGDIVVKESDFNNHDKPDVQNNRLNNVNAVNDVNSKLYKMVLETLAAGRLPLVLGGDHAIAAGSATAMQRHFGEIGVIWVDAHGDYNNAESSPSGNIHGMPLSAITGNGPDEILPFKEKDTPFIDPKNVALIGVRSLDTGEKENIKKAGVSVFTIADIDKDGMYSVISEAVRIASDGTKGIYLSFDLDAIDPDVAPGVGTPVNGGITYREAHLLCEYIAASGKLLGIEIVELNPILDNRNRTGEVAVQMISSLLNKRIL